MEPQLHLHLVPKDIIVNRGQEHLPHVTQERTIIIRGSQTLQPVFHVHRVSIVKATGMSYQMVYVTQAFSAEVEQHQQDQETLDH